jgi:redox-sensitive bicupin YhaK (pirin superfamily)
MIRRRPREARGRTQIGWLDGRHSFSFGNYFDPDHMGFRVLRVINEDVVQPGTGFGMHGHRDMEIVTVILDGELEHRDSLENGAVIRPGIIQRMTAGTGIRHSEFNPSKTEPVHLLQIWIEPSKRGLPPSYEDKELAPTDEALERIVRPVGSGEGVAKNEVLINQDASIYRGNVSKEQTVRYPIGTNRGVWIQMTAGEVEVNGVALTAGDGAAIEAENELIITSPESGSFLLFDLP